MWSTLAASDRVADTLRAEDAAVADHLLLSGRPAAEDVFSGKMDNGVEAAGQAWLQWLQRVPRDFILGANCAGFQASDGVSVGGERRQQGQSNGSRHAAGQNFHDALLLLR